MSTDRYRQRIPRPISSRRGELPPWTNRTDLIDPTVGEVASILDPIDSEGFDESAAAVLLPIVERSDGLSLIFIRRASTLSMNPGHVAFPGGRRDSAEAVVATALRETEEEIGLDQELVTVIGALAPSVTASDGTFVAPFVGLVDGDPTFVLNPTEVDAVIEIPLVALYRKETVWVEMWQRDGDEHERAVHFFADEALFGDDLLWGLTARILWDLLHRIWVATEVE